CATELPLVVAITTIATESGHMRTSTAAGLVGAAMLSTLVYPFVGLALRQRSEQEGEAELAIGLAAD
ncbi:MAG: sodium/hydrogen exchanger, partial [Solirubrobacterales bacterium]|nr:sodium/hydrogen exchanger [Solirubrobacterales bacterium]